MHGSAAGLGVIVVCSNQVAIQTPRIHTQYSRCTPVVYDAMLINEDWLEVIFYILRN